MRQKIAAAIALLQFVGCATAQRRPDAPARKVIVVVWDGMRPDAIDLADTPNLARLRDAGVDFADHHSTYPTFTMMNSASFATGAFPDVAGYYGNVVWQPGANGRDSGGKQVDFRQPVFSEDYAILDDLKESWQGRLLLVDTLFDVAQKAGISTLTLGKNGAAYLQDASRGGMVLDERTVIPLSLAKELQAAGIPLPVTAPNTYAAGELVLAANNGSPTDVKPPHRLNDGVSSDPTDAAGSVYKAEVEYVINAYVDYLLPQKRPRLSLLWLRDPDSTQHAYGLGTPNARDALRSADALLGRVLVKVEQLGEADSTDIIVVSDHGHSNLSGPTGLFPLRAIRDGEVAGVEGSGHPVSGLVRLADLLRRGGFTAFDGLGCTYLPVATGIRGDGARVYPSSTDRDGSVCGKAGQNYQLPPFKVPAQLPANALVVAVNGGSDYIYVPDHDPSLVRKTVAFLQGRAEVGAIFVDDRYRGISGTMALSTIHAQNAAGRNPDIILSYDFDENAVTEGVRGTEMAGMLLGNNNRGMHGNFSPRDVHNTLIAFGPDFRRGFKDPLPSGNVDLAPTVARILGLALPRAQGRPLLEAMVDGAVLGDYRVAAEVMQPDAPATGVVIRLPTDPDGKEIDSSKNSYTFELHTKSLTYGGNRYRYFDFAKAIRR